MSASAPRSAEPRGHRRHRLPFDVDRRPAGVEHRLLEVRRQIVVELAAEDQRHGEVEVPRVGHVLRDLVETLSVEIDVVRLRAVDDSLFQRRVELAERHRRRLRAQGVEGVDQDRGRNDPDLETLEVVGGDDRSLRIPRVAPAGEPVTQHEDVEFLFDPVGDALADRSVEHAVEVVEVPEDEGEVEDLGLRDEGGDAAAGARGRGGERAQLDHEGRLLLGAELLVLEDLHRHGAAGPFLENPAELLESGLERVSGRPVVGDLEHGDAVAAAAAGEQGEGAERERGGAKGITHSRASPAARA